MLITKKQYFLIMLLTLLVMTPELFAKNNASKLKFTTPPDIQINPNPKVPLAAIVKINARGATRVQISVANSKRQWEIDAPLDELATIIPILGMRANTVHDIKIQLLDEGGDQLTWQDKLTYTTPPLPSDRYIMPRYNVIKAETEKMEPGITILSIRRALPVRAQDRNFGQQKFVTRFGLLLGIDNEGEVVWYYQTNERISGIDRLENGNIIYHLHSYESVEIDMLGNTINSWYAEKRPQGESKIKGAIPIRGLQTLHHQPHEIKSGTFLSFAANWRLIENWYTNEYDPKPRKTQKVMGDTIVEFNKKGDILWSWNSFDYLDVFHIGYGAFNPYWVTRGFPDTWDWSHGNGVSYDDRDDSVVASFKLLSSVIKIDKKSKDIKWIFGDHGGWGEEFKNKLLTPVGNDFRWPNHQHNPRWTDAGTLLVFNNNRSASKPFDGQPLNSFEGNYSYTAEYEINEIDATVRQIWSSEPDNKSDYCSSTAMSESHRLPKTNNILEINALCMKQPKDRITWDPWDRSKRHIAELPHGGRVREYAHTMPAEILFEATFADPGGAISWQVYGGFRTPSLYENYHGIIKD